MIRTFTKILTLFVVALLCSAQAFAQSDGDYRSFADGDWDDENTWQVYNETATDWEAAATAPTGSEIITITDTVTVATSVSVSGEVAVSGEGVLTVGAGDLTFADGSTYDHARDGGEVPVSTWATGSTFMLTGTTGDAPSDRGQDYHHIVLNTPDKSSNTDLDLAGHTIGGDITVVSTGSSRWYLMGGSSGTGEGDISTSAVTIMGDVTVQDGEFATQGTSSAYSEYIVNHHGSVNVTGGNFSIARGSQSGLGTTSWNFMTDGASFTMADAETQSSNPEGGYFVFAANGTQIIDFSNVDYGSRINWTVSDTTTLDIATGTEFTATGVLTNEGVITANGTIIVDGDGTYDHAQNGGDIPDITWDEGSTAIFSGITTDAPGNRGQNYYNLTLNTPGLVSNRDLDMDGVTIGGNLRVIDSGSARWRLFGGSAGTVTIMGDVIVEGGSIETNGTGSVVDQVVEHHGDVIVTGGTFAITRGSMGDGTPEGTGSVTWNLHEGDFSVSDAQVRSSISLKGNAKFVFASDASQTLTIGENVTFDQLPVEVASGATLDLGESVIEGNDVFIINGTVATSLAGGFEAALLTSGDITVGAEAGFLYNGSAAQTAGLVAIADTVNAIVVENSAGVSFNDTLYTAGLNISEGSEMKIDTAGSVSVGGGSVEGSIVNMGALEVDESASLAFGGSASYEHARDGGEIPTGTWAEGSTMILTGTVLDAPANRGQDYYNITLNTPDLVSNSDLSLHGNTISGDIHIVNTGVARWYLTSPAGDAEVTREVTIMGDVIMEQGQFSTNGSGSLGDIVVHHYGNAVVNEGNFSISRGSKPTVSWYFHTGDFTLNAGTSQNSADNADQSKWVFAGGPDVVHNLTLAADYNIEGKGMEMVISDSTSLDLGESEITSGGDFTAEGGSTLLTSHAEGFDGNLQMTGTLTLSNEGNFTFNGTAAQITSFTMPLTVNGLTIDNEAGVLQSRPITINGFLRLANGVFDNTAGFTLGDEAEVIEENGSLLVPLDDGVSNENQEEIPDVFAIEQNYPNPFNPTTTINYDIPEATNVSIKVYDITGREVAELVNAKKSAGSHTVDWNAEQFATGVYLYRITAGDFTAVRKLTLIK